MKKIVISVVILLMCIVLIYFGIHIYTKSFSPQDTATYTNNGVQISVEYCRPFKKERKIFGELVPYEEVWRTGANEATIFTTNTDLMIANKLLPKGSYSLFSVPTPEEWTIIFNRETGQWGIDALGGKANRDPEDDVLTVEIPSTHTSEVYEQFTITFKNTGQEVKMILVWDQTEVVVNMLPAKSSNTAKFP